MTGSSERGDRARGLLSNSAVPKIEIPQGVERTRRQFKLPDELNTPIPERMPAPPKEQPSPLEDSVAPPSPSTDAPATEDTLPALATKSRPKWPWIAIVLVLAGLAAGAVLMRLQ